MPGPIVALTVDCTCALNGKCYVSGIVEATEQAVVPCTWLLGVSEHDPMSNVKLYHNEYLHRIPAWHELGLFLSFDTGASNTVDRGDLIRVGKDILKQFSIKPTAFRAANGDLEAGDIKALEDIGILIDSTPGSSAELPKDTPRSPYHPSYTHPYQQGEAKLWIAPVAHVNGVRGYIDQGFDALKSVIDAHLTLSDILVLGMTDCVDNRENLVHVIAYLKQKGARFITLTQLVSEL
ncbi:MAG TPA: hypothetical protein VKV18_07550 [Chthonomonas sp.]|uniref:hypothetical protein n=1 Tax=Chthonomonas sp. TaxID=2282153 RepID=UPI002B4B218F|nr:hypothetical protein [Chthonomonas sp.]HLI48521.1 hypothetical protein [Chthonomonas sp.]